MDQQRKKFHLIMAGCGIFMVLAVSSLAYVASRPQTTEVQEAEGKAVLACWQRSNDPVLPAISRIELTKSCKEMEKQYVHKFGAKP